MSAPKRPSDDQDPDYASPGPTNAKQQKLYEDKARANTANKIIGIVEREFTKEIDDKEKEVLEIQNRLHKALKTLHLVRYVVITDYYNRKQCQAPSQSGESKQTHIHPAIKRLIGKAPKKQKGLGLEDPLEGPSTSKDFQENFEETSDNKDGIRIEIEKRLGIIKSEGDEENEEKNKTGSSSSCQYSMKEENTPKKIPRYIPPRSNLPIVTSPSRGVRHKVRKRIVVGNISKWIPPDWREDGASHKWMMYVRGSKDSPDITDFVSKVRFFLHPSYQPNDVVQVVSPPFHLSRRGWGEFPLRVQLHFKNSLNKPMDIIHYLKLDRTYTGLQTLGSETVVDIWIHATTPHNIKKNLSEEISNDQNNPSASRNNEIDLSNIKQECPQGLEAIENSTDFLDNSIKTEPIDRRSSVEDNYQLLTENTIKLEHNYVSNNCGEDGCSEVVHSMENNVTIKHSPSFINQEIEKSGSDLASRVPASEEEVNEISVSYVDLINSDNIVNLHQRRENSSANESQENLMHRENDNEQKNKDLIKVEPISNGQCKSIDEIETNKKTEVKNIGKNVQNGDAVPIKLVKCNDKFFLMTDMGKLPSNKADFVKIANSDVVKNILAKRIQPTKLSVLGGNTESLGLKRIMTVKSNQDKTELSNGQNGAENNKPENSTIMNSTEKESLAFKEGNLDRNILIKNNSQRLELQRLASSLKSIPSKSEPLKITIPPPFEPTKLKKQILVLKNNKLISVNTSNNLSLAAINSRQLAARSMLLDKSQEPKTENRNKISLTLAAGKSTEGTSLLKPSVSILKKPIANNNLIKIEPIKPSAAVKTVLKMNPSNSLLLNSSSSIPALQIATPLQSLQNERRNMIQQNRIGQLKLKRLPKGVKIDDIEDSKPMKVSVTLGKDKQKILSKRDSYEDVLRSIETVEINDIVGTLRYIMRRIPLITEDARDSDYKQMHPYACPTREEFFNYHLGKQRAHEWYRAKMVRSLLKKKGFENDRLWSVKEILNWSRIHGFTPVQSSLTISLVNSNKSSKKLPDMNSSTVSTCTESMQFNEWLENSKDCENNSDDDNDIEIDVVHIADVKVKKEIKSEITDPLGDSIALEIDPSLQLPCAFVNETARDIGIRLKNEEIIPGVSDSAAEKTIARAMQCFVDDIVRRSLSKAWERNSNKCPDTIILDDVRGALMSREEFDLFTNEGLGSLQNIG